MDPAESFCCRAGRVCLRRVSHTCASRLCVPRTRRVSLCGPQSASPGDDASGPVPTGDHANVVIPDITAATADRIAVDRRGTAKIHEKPSAKR